jgi:hypothetical protein
MEWMIPFVLNRLYKVQFDRDESKRELEVAVIWRNWYTQ